MKESKSNTMLRILFYHTLILTKIFTQILVNGNATYFNPETENDEPIKNAYILVHTENPIITKNGYTDENGNYSFSLGSVYPEMVTVRLFFKNEKVNLKGFDGTRADFVWCC